jgi:EAL domain-containing protein (putative c-di-GMP-specific phosphodiesterase class I)
VVAEGVETEQDAHLLASYGCDLAQGFRYTKALPADQLDTWLDQHIPHPHTPQAHTPPSAHERAA